MCEILLCRPLLAGKDEVHQLTLIFNLLGAPNLRIWPLLMSMPLIQNGTIDIDREQIDRPYSNLPLLFPSIHDEGTDLISRLLAYDPCKRLTASDALQHSYFQVSPFPKQEALMPTFPSLHNDLSLPLSHGTDGMMIRDHGMMIRGADLTTTSLGYKSASLFPGTRMRATSTGAKRTKR